MSTFNKNIILSSIILASVASSSFVQAAPFGLEARSVGMGNVSVATADIATAALANPAMLSYQQADEDFSLLLGGGVFIDDNDNMIDSIDDFQASLNVLDDALLLPQTEANVNTQINAINQMSVDGNALSGRTLAPSGTFAAVVGFSFKEYSLAFSARSDISVAVGLTNVNFGTGAIALLPAGATAGAVTTGANAVTTLENTINNSGNNIFEVTGAVITELGLSGAKSFIYGDQKFSVGLTPKIISAEVFTSATPLSSFDTDAGELIDTDNSVDLDGTFTVDVGVVAEISERTQVGLVIKNLIEDELASGTTRVNVSRQVKAGIAYTGDLFTIGIDLDLLEVDPVVTNINFQSKATQMASIGLEFNAWDFMQLRLGMQQNLADNPGVGSDDPLITAGVGIWIGVNIDVAVIANDNSIGGFVQTGFKF